jgi:hypothetical protein
MRWTHSSQKRCVALLLQPLILRSDSLRFWMTSDVILRFWGAGHAG